MEKIATTTPTLALLKQVTTRAEEVLKADGAKARAEARAQTTRRSFVSILNKLLPELGYPTLGGNGAPAPVIDKTAAEPAANGSGKKTAAEYPFRCRKGCTERFKLKMHRGRHETTAHRKPAAKGKKAA